MVRKSEAGRDFVKPFCTDEFKLYMPFVVVTRIIESTSALDLEGEIEVWNSLMTELRRSTIICVTHVSEVFFLLLFLELELEGRVTEIVIITQCYFPCLFSIQGVYAMWIGFW